MSDTAAELFEEAPCGYLITAPDGLIERVNRTFEALTGLDREELVGVKRFQELLTPGGQIYHETHYRPLLQMQCSVRAIAVEMVRADGTRVPVLVNSTLTESGIRTTVFDATDRRRYEQELLAARHRDQQTAHELQQSLLTGDLPTVAGLELGVVYRPGVSGLTVGGDWYDAFWIHEGVKLALVVGDVVGRGIGAAATMGQLRSATRALALAADGPAAVLESLDAYAHRHRVGLMATVVYAELEVANGKLCFACAGHPPPIVAGPGGGRVEWSARSLPLAVAIGHTREESRMTLAPGESLVLYTDGLVEHRRQPLDESIAELAAMAAGREGDAPAQVASDLVDALRDADESDDVCVLVLRRDGDDGAAGGSERDVAHDDALVGR
jgi:sigma-B regulation protein RsbU (phosphoserine phosphatase)